MSDLEFGFMITLTFMLGLLVGFSFGEDSESAERKVEVIELSIELTTLEIKKLKGVCNG